MEAAELRVEATRASFIVILKITQARFIVCGLWKNANAQTGTSNVCLDWKREKPDDGREETTRATHRDMMWQLGLKSVPRATGTPPSIIFRAGGGSSFNTYTVAGNSTPHT